MRNTWLDNPTNTPENSENIREKLGSYIKEADIILSKNSDNQRIQKEYSDFKESILSSLNEINTESREWRKDLAKDFVKMQSIISREDLIAQIDNSEFASITKEFLELRNYNEADNATYAYNTSSFLKAEWNWFVSNGKEIPKSQINKIKSNSDIFLNWNISLEELSDKEIWWMLSWIETLIENWDVSYKDKLIQQLSKFPEWLIHLKNNWESISRKLQFEAVLINPLINDLIDSTQIAINDEIYDFVSTYDKEFANSDKFKEIQNKINEKLEKWWNINELIWYLEKISDWRSNEEILWVIWRLSWLNSVKQYFSAEEKEEKIKTSLKKWEITKKEAKEKLKITEILKNSSQKSEIISKSIKIVLDNNIIDTEKYLDFVKKWSTSAQALEKVTKDIPKDKLDKKTRDSIDNLIKTEKELQNKLNLLQSDDSEKAPSDEPKIKNTENIEDKNLSYIENTYENSNWTYDLILDSWEELTWISKEEYSIVKESNENLENMVKLKSTLTELNLEFIWNNRYEFITRLNNLDPTINIKIDSWNYIDETEMKKMLNWIIQLTWNEKNSSNDLDWIKMALRIISSSWLDENKKDLTWSPIEKIFIDKWIIDKNKTISYFNSEKMKQNFK